MRFKCLNLATLLLTVLSCEIDPQISIEFKPTPVIYAIFDKADTISHIYLVKSFSGDPTGPLINSTIADSIYFHDVSIEAELLCDRIINDDRTIVISKWETAIEEIVLDRKPGIFIHPYGRRYTLLQNLDSCYFVRLTIYVPSFDTIKVKTPVISPPVMDYPQSDNSWIKFHQTNVLSIRWYGYAWNELKVSIEIETTTLDSYTIPDTLVFYKNNVIFPEDPKTQYYVSSFSFESYLALLNNQLSYVPNVKFRRIKNISVEVICGNDDFKNYMNHFGEIIDNVLTTYHSEPQSLVTSKSSKRITGLQLDPESITSLEMEPRLAKFKFIYGE